MIVKPTISFLNRCSDPDLGVKICAILLAMQGNVHYPKPTPTLPVVGAALDAFTSALVDAYQGGTALTAAKNARRKTLVALVRALALYVQQECQGDYSILLSSGFPPHKPFRASVGLLPPPAGLALALGRRNGELDASVSPVANAVFYSWRATDVQTGEVVQTNHGSPASTTFTGLVPGKVYLVDGSVSSTAGASGWCKPIPQMVI